VVLALVRHKVGEPLVAAPAGGKPKLLELAVGILRDKSTYNIMCQICKRAVGLLHEARHMTLCVRSAGLQLAYWVRRERDALCIGYMLLRVSKDGHNPCSRDEADGGVA
jgi:hypothetical protein